MKIGKLMFDKYSLVHIGMSFLICFLVGMFMWKVSDEAFITGMLSGIIASLGYDITREWTDKDCGGIFDWADILCDVVGVILGVVFMWCVVG